MDLQVMPLMVISRVFKKATTEVVQDSGSVHISFRTIKPPSQTEKLWPAFSLVNVHYLRPREGLVGPVSV